MWNPFKNKATQITDSQSQLLELLKEDKKRRAEEAKLIKEQREAQAASLVEASNRKKMARMARRRSAYPHLQAIQRYMNMRDLADDPVRKADLTALITDRIERCRARGVDVSDTIESVQEAFRGC